MREDQKVLWTKYFKTKDIKTRNRLVEMNMPIAKKIAHRFWLYVEKKHDAEDLRSLAYMGLISAVEKYDPDRGMTFAAYAFMKVRHHMIEYSFKTTYGTSKVTLMRAFSIYKFIITRNEETGLFPTVEETCALFKIQKRTYTRALALINRINPLSIHSLGGSSDCPEDRISYNRDLTYEPYTYLRTKKPLVLYAHSEYYQAPELTREVTERVIHGNECQSDLAKEYNMSKQAINQHYLRAIAELKELKEAM